MSRKKLSRRQFVAATALVLRGAHSTAPLVRQRPCRRQTGDRFLGSLGCPAPTAPRPIWSMNSPEKAKVEVTVDYIPSQGNKNLLTIAAEAQAKSGHDIPAMPTWWASAQCRNSSSPSTTSWGRSWVENGVGQWNGCIIWARRGRQMAGCSRLRRQPDQGAWLAN